MEFEWDAKKATANEKKHGVSLEEASTAFGDPLSLTIPDPDHSEHEDRMLLLGRSSAGNLLVVGHTQRGERIRLINARRANRRERRKYEEESPE